MSIDYEVQGAVSALGCLDGENYEKEPDCLETVKDIIRYLRRDTDTSSFKVRRQLTSLNVIQKDLIPILRTYTNEAELFETTLKLLINLTQPLTEKKTKQDESEQVFDPRSVIAQRLQLIDDLRRTKRAFADEKLFTVVKDKLSLLLSLDWEQRQEEDRLLIERLLVLIRNILSVPAPVEDILERTQHDLSAHDQIVWVMHQTKLDELLLDLSCGESHREFHVYVLGIVSLMLRQHAPEVLASTGTIRTNSERRQEQQHLAGIHAKETSKKLTQLRQCSGRHTSFAGSYTVYGLKGLNQAKDIVLPRPLTKTEDITFDSRKRGRKIPRNRAPAIETTADLALISSEHGGGRGSALEIRSILKEFCNRFIMAAYNKFMHSIQYALDRRNTMADGGSRYHFWWLMRYFTAFVRHSGVVDENGPNWKHVSETLSIHCLHEAQTQLEECLDTVRIEKKEAVQWGRRAHIILKAYGEILMMLQHLDRGKDEEGIDMAMELKKTIFYIMEYREELLTSLKQYHPAAFTKSYLRDLVEITHVYLKMLESHCLVYGDELKVQKKQRRRRSRKRKGQVVAQEDQQKGPEGLTEDEKRNRLEDAWNNLANDLSTLLREAQSNADLLPKDVVAFDAVAEHGFDDKIVSQIRIQNALKSNDFPKALALLHCCRSIWPAETALFGELTFTGPEDDFLLMRNLFLTELPVVPGENDNGPVNQAAVDTDSAEPELAEKGGRDLLAGGREDDSDSDDQENNYVTSEVEFSFSHYVQRFAHSDILKWYIVILADFSSNTVQLNHCVIKMFHRISYDLKMAPILYQARLFRTFQTLLNTPGFTSQPGARELVTFAKHFLTGFFLKASKDRNLFVEILFWKGFKEAYEIEYGYGSFEEKKKEKKRKSKKGKSEESHSETEPQEEKVPEQDDAEFMPSAASEPRPKKRRTKKQSLSRLPEPEGTSTPVKPKRKKRTSKEVPESKMKRRKAINAKAAAAIEEPLESEEPPGNGLFENHNFLASPIQSSPSTPTSPVRSAPPGQASCNQQHMRSSSSSDAGSPVVERKRRAVMVFSDDD